MSDGEFEDRAVEVDGFEAGPGTHWFAGWDPGVGGFYAYLVDVSRDVAIREVGVIRPEPGYEQYRLRSINDLEKAMGETLPEATIERLKAARSKYPELRHDAVTPGQRESRGKPGARFGDAVRVRHPGGSALGR